MIPIINVEGNTYQQGIIHGKQLRDQIAHNLEVYFNRFEHEAGLSRIEILRRAKIYQPELKKVNINYFNGVKGISNGSGFSLEEIITLNIRYEILYYESAMKSFKGMNDGCTAFAVMPNKTKGLHLLIGQNWDWIPNVACAVIRSFNTHGNHVLTFTEAGIFGGKIGFNSSGLGLLINGLTTTQENWQSLAKPFHVRCYEILLQTKIDDAIEVITNTLRPCSANYLLAQLPDRAVNVETTPNAHYCFNSENDILVHTNHFVALHQLGITEPPNSGRDWSCIRLDQCSKLLKSLNHIEINDLKKVLSTHRNLPPTICRHVDNQAPVDQQYETIASIIMNLNLQELYISNGPPCINEYVKVTLK